MLTLETAKQLKEAGWGKETERSFAQCIIPSSNGYGENTGYELCESRFIGYGKYSSLDPYSCPSLEELLAEMPGTLFPKAGGFFHFYMYKSSSTEETVIVDDEGDKIEKLPCNTYTFDYSLQVGDSEWDIPYIARSQNPAEAVAQLWIKLKQEGLC